MTVASGIFIALVGGILLYMLFGIKQNNEYKPNSPSFTQDLEQKVQTDEEDKGIDYNPDGVIT